MKKALAFLVLIVLLGVLGISSSDQAMRWISKARYQQQGNLGSDKYRFGDLYGLTYLPAFRLEKDTSLISNQYTSPGLRDTDLYIIGDSYLYSYMQMDTSNFARAKRLDFRKWSDGGGAPIAFTPSSHKKVLLIESVERNIWNVIDIMRVKAHLEGYRAPLTWDEKLNACLADALYDPNLEQNIDFTLFNFQALSFIKSFKAQGNLSLFNRTTADVVLSEDQQFLYMKETMDSMQKGSSFYPLRSQNIQDLLGRMAKIEQYAESRGFDEVVFSFIPNPVAITQTESTPTNHLIPSLAYANQGRLNLVDPTQVLIKGGKSYFFRSDSHWNQQGAQAWLNQMNQYLLKL
ncbi:hypothetical protein PQG44_09905 [Aquirufa sp. LEPPI-3A]|uniref:hypothetical protein n=1 Tax=Aquirufa regiilacus TaxID=3024868 RepID=UPI0028DF0D59|nr:hypothetical protein [Aquirufa sp. LEPPI-3A]MDT8887991.1 hypothetical protein [Aquirufa sp. LEPPI-3A]